MKLPFGGHAVLALAALCAALTLLGPDPRAQSSVFGDGEWRHTELEGARVMVEGQAIPCLRFDEAAGRFSGTAGCNRMTGAFNRQDGHIAFSQVAATRMACLPELDQRERQFADMLAHARDWRITGERLEIMDNGGAVLAVLTRPAVGTVHGQMTYRERVALPAGAEAMAEVRAGERVLAEQHIPLRGAQVPIPFSISVEWPFSAGDLTARVSITVNGRPL